MSLRERAAWSTANETIAKASEGPRTSGAEPRAASRKAESSNATNGASPRLPIQKRRKSLRLNHVLGKLVPVVLLVYVAYTYDLVVFRYAFRYSYLARGRTLGTALWMLGVHSLLLLSLRAYFRVFFAHEHPYSSKLKGRGLLACLRSRLGARFTGPEHAQQLEQRLIAHGAVRLARIPARAEIQVELCQRDGQPVRCWRDDCAGRIKALRTRHCGDCGTCRVGFDHHCAWFDNDVTVPATLASFVGFLVSIPPLCLLGLGPLLPSAWQTLRRIHAFASIDAGLGAYWWSRWYSWIGGPAFRWMVGFTLGARRWSASATHRLAHESARTPILIAIGAVFVLIATALATSSLLHLRQGMLTVDLERSKAFAKLERRQRALEQALNGAKDDQLAEVRRTMVSLAPVQYFRIHVRDSESGETQEEIVALSIREGLLSHGSFWTNLKCFCGFAETAALRAAPWSLSESTLGNVLEKTSVQMHH